jgi:Ca2+-binding RTX toxin-like protein
MGPTSTVYIIPDTGDEYDSELVGEQGVSVLWGGSGRNFIVGAGGADDTRGGAGNDTFRLYYGDFQPGEHIEGGGGLRDTIEVKLSTNSGSTADVDIRSGAISGIEILRYIPTADGAGVHGSTVTVSASQMGMGGINAIWGGQGVDTLHIANAAFTDLSIISFTDWSSLGDEDILDITTNGGNIGQLTGTVLGDTIYMRTANLGSVDGYTGNDVFVFDATSGSVAVAGGAGNDTIRLDNATLDFSNWDSNHFGVGVERILFNTGTSTVTLQSSFLKPGSIGTIVGSQNVDTVVFATSSDSGFGVNISSLSLSNWTEGVDTISINDVFNNNPSTLIGSAYADRINDAGGNDIITGGGGSDIFVVGGGNDTITDFAAGSGSPDKLDLKNFPSFHTLGDVRAHAAQVGNNTVIDLGGGNSLTLQNVQKSFLSVDDFLGLAPAARNFNNDTHSDILWQNDNGQAAIWLMDGATPLARSAVGQNPGSTWHEKAAADFNGDGMADILLQNDNGQAAMWLMNGLNSIAEAAVSFNPGSSWHANEAGDFNGDGKADILWQNDNGQAAIWLMNGPTPLAQSAVGTNPGSSWHEKAAADFNGDGMADILWQNDNGQAAIWLMNGLNSIAEAIVSFNPGASWHVKGAGDFNADGRADILWQNDNGQAAIWLMDGTNPLAQSAVGANPGPGWHIKDALDFNADGKSDILLQNDNGQAAVWLMDGLNSTLETTVGTNPGADWHVI